MNILNNFYEKIYIFFNLYIKNTIHKKKPYYAEDKEDLLVLKKIRKKNGYFVDVGCFHPTRINNTYLLYKKGWRGLNIDMNKFSIKLFDLVRPHDINIHSAVSSVKGEIFYYTSKKLALSSSLSKSKNLNIKVKVNSDSLNNIICSSKFKNKKIDFLSLDCEGHDLEVLKTINLKKYSPKIICIEIPKSVYGNNIKKNLIYKYLVSKRYEIIFSSNNNCMFEKKNSNF
tara:strand:+ start:570 stop:1253 length:684 start_codon:yes stop_codon:yes gene_type:complete